MPRRLWVRSSFVLSAVVAGALVSCLLVTSQAVAQPAFTESFFMAPAAADLPDGSRDAFEACVQGFRGQLTRSAAFVERQSPEIAATVSDCVRDTSSPTFAASCDLSLARTQVDLVLVLSTRETSAGWYFAAQMMAPMSAASIWSDHEIAGEPDGFLAGLTSCEQLGARFLSWRTGGQAAVASPAVGPGHTASSGSVVGLALATVDYQQVLARSQRARQAIEEGAASRQQQAAELERLRAALEALRADLVQRWDDMSEEEMAQAHERLASGQYELETRREEHHNAEAELTASLVAQFDASARAVAEARSLDGVLEVGTEPNRLIYSARDGITPSSFSDVSADDLTDALLAHFDQAEPVPAADPVPVQTGSK